MQSGSTLLIDRLWPAEGSRVWRAIVLAVSGSALLWASAKVQVPMWPVPMTMQTFVVLMIGMTYGLRLGTATVALYLAEGALGLPVFAGTPERGVGMAYMAGPTGGFLAGFLLAVAAMGWLAERGWDRTTWKTLAALAIGTVVPFATGLAWLVGFTGWEKAVALGLTPFLAGAAVKLALAASVLGVLGQWAGRKTV